MRELDVFSVTPSGALSAIIPILQMRKQSLSAGENILGFTFQAVAQRALYWQPVSTALRAQLKNKKTFLMLD